MKVQEVRSKYYLLILNNIRPPHVLNNIVLILMCYPAQPCRVVGVGIGAQR